jgi:hypothetical protein
LNQKPKAKMAITVYEYRPIYISLGFMLKCRIDSENDIVMLQELFVDLCCRCLDIGDILLGYDEENNPVNTNIKYPVNEPFTMIFNNLDKTLIVASINEDPDQCLNISFEAEDDS